MTQWINIYLDAQPVADAEEYTEVITSCGGRAASTGTGPRRISASKYNSYLITLNTVLLCEKQNGN